MRVFLYANREVGAVALRTLVAEGVAVPLVVVDEGYGDRVLAAARELRVPVYNLIHVDRVREENPDLLLCVHGRRKLSKAILDAPPLGCWNVHPCLSWYPGADPIGRALAAGRTEASVAVHRMVEEVDAGPIAIELWTSIEGLTTREAVYAALYPVYAEAVRWLVREVR